MSVEAIQQTQHKSSLMNGFVSAAVGAGVGLAAKYVLPLTNQEKDAEYSKMISLISERSRKAQKEFMVSLKDFKPLACDVYVKEMSKNLEKQNINAYNRALKKIRPASPFIVVGAVMGFLVSFVRKAFATEL